MTVYGLSNCDSTKAAVKWLMQEQVSITFYDFKLNGIGAERLEKWLEQVSLEKLLNKKSTTWRGLTADQQAVSSTKKGAVNLLGTHTTLIKRPLVEWANGMITVGFDEAIFEAMLKQQ